MICNIACFDFAVIKWLIPPGCYNSMYVCMYIRTYVRTYVCAYVCAYVCTYVCTYVRMYVHTYVRMYVSLSTIVLNSRDRQGMYGMQHFCASKNKPYNKL